MEAIRRTLAPVEAEVRKRFGNFIVAENDSTLEGAVLDALSLWPGTAVAHTHRKPTLAKGGIFEWLATGSTGNSPYRYKPS